MKQDITLDIALLYCYGFLGYIWFDLGLRPSEELMRKCIH